ncbi:hypothetical protein P7C71_g2121, partial [Lecanoromycetidae sp. Uapishka_2]
MGLIDLLPSFVQTLVGITLFYVLYYVHWELTVGASRRALISKHGCKPIKANPEYNSFPNNIIGIKAAKENYENVKAHKFMEGMRERFLRKGTTMQTSTLFSQVIHTIEPENLKTIMAFNFEHWSLSQDRQGAFAPLLGEGIFTTNGVKWKHSRELLRPNFARAQVADLNTFEVHVAHLIKAIPRDGSTVNLQDLFFQLTLDSATEFLFGESTNCLGSDFVDASGGRFAEAFNRSQENISEGFRSGKIGQLLLYNRKEHKGDIEFCHDFVDHFVRKGLEHRKTLDLEKAEKVEERYVFLNELVKHTRDPIQIRSELLNVLLAGRDTTASLLSDVWFILARRPDIWAKLKAEVDALGGQKPTFQQIKDMKYLKWVLNESLRLFPVVPGNSRQAVVDTVLPRGGGEDGKSPVLIPAGQVVMWSLWTMHRRKDFYGEDAEEFKPERWETLKPGWEYLPFNGGPRICLGQQFALTEASYTTIRLMQEFKTISSRDDRPWQEWLTLTCAIHQGTLVGMTPM